MSPSSILVTVSLALLTGPLATKSHWSGKKLVGRRAAASPRATWLNNDHQVAFARRKGKVWEVCVFDLRTRKTSVASALDFRPRRLSAGPAGTVIVEGPCREKMAGVRKPKKESRDGGGGKKKRSATSKKKKMCAGDGSTSGLYLVGNGRRQYLFPGSRAKWSLRARRLLLFHRGVMYLWNPTGKPGKEMLLLTSAIDADWAPDGKAIVFSRRSSAAKKKKGLRQGIVVVDMRFRSVPLAPRGEAPRWGGQGKHGLIVYLARAKTGSKGGASAPGVLFGVVTRGKPRPRRLSGAVVKADVSADGKLVATQKKGNLISLLEPATGTLGTLCRACSEPSWSPRGQRLLVALSNGWAVVAPRKTKIRKAR